MFRPRAMRLVVLVLSLIWATAVVFCPVVLGAQLDTASAASSARSTPSIVLTSISKYVKPQSTLTIKGQLVNPTQLAYSGIRIRLSYEPQAFQNRGQVEQYAQGQGANPGSATAPQGPGLSVQPGRQAKWALNVPIKQMDLSADFGVHAMLVTATDALGRPLASQRTFFVYTPNDQSLQPKTKIAWIWPVIDRPRRTNDTTFTDDGLEQEFAPKGRLSTLVDATQGSKTQVSWLVDPGLVDDAAAMADHGGFTVQTAHHVTSPVAGPWLADLGRATTSGPSFITPYADPDVMALTHADRAADIKAATAYGAKVGLGIPGTLGPQPSATLTMPPDGAVDGATLQQLVANGADTVVLSSDSLPPDDQTLTYTPNPRTVLRVAGHNVSAIAYDSPINQILASATHGPGQTVLAEQRFLAETAMVAAEQPNLTRTVVAAPPRRWNPAPAFAKAVLADSGKAPWLKSVPLDTVRRLPPTRRSLAPKGDGGLSSSYLAGVKRLGDAVAQFSSILVKQSSGFELGVPRAESSAWRSDPDGGVALRDQLNHQLNTQISSIKILNSHVSLAGRSGQIPLTITNELRKGTVTVQLKAVAKNPNQLVIGHYKDKKTIEAGHSDSITIPVKSQANGVAVVSVELVGPNGEHFWPPTDLRVRSTAYGETALIITGGSLAVLFLTVGVRIVRRTRRGDGGEGRRA